VVGVEVDAVVAVVEVVEVVAGLEQRQRPREEYAVDKDTRVPKSQEVSSSATLVVHAVHGVSATQHIPCPRQETAASHQPEL
jgi:hypothetical protein